MTCPLRAVVFSIVPSPYQRDLFAALAARPEVELTVYYSEGGSPDSPWPEKELRPYEHILKGFYVSWRNSRFIINHSLPDISGSQVIVFNGYVTLPAQRLLRRQIPQRKIFWGERRMHAPKGPRRQVQEFLARPLQGVDAIVAIGEGARRDYARHYPGKPVYALPYTCSLADFVASRKQQHDGVPTILFCGQMILRKGLDTLLDAFERIIARGVEARLLLVGREAELPAMLAKLSPATRERIEYAGFQAPEALPGFFGRADIFVLPSRYDGWGVVVNQAVGAALPVITSTAVGAAEDLVRPGVNGDVFEPGDVDRLTELLEQRLTEPEMRLREGRASAELANDITPEAAAQAWVDILKTTVEGKR